MQRKNVKSSHFLQRTSVEQPRFLQRKSVKWGRKRLKSLFVSSCVFGIKICFLRKQTYGTLGNVSLDRAYFVVGLWSFEKHSVI